MKTRRLLTLTLALTLGFLASANADVIVFQDTFDDGDIATNPGIGGEFSQVIVGGNGFTEAGGFIDADTSVNNNRAYAYSTNSFDLSNGFTLDFIANASNLGSGSANRFSVGLAAAGADFSAAATSGRNFLGDSRAVFEGVGIDFTTDGGQGLSFNDGLGLDPGTETTVVSNEQTITADLDLDVSLTVNADGSYSYSINGAPATTGAAFGLDLSQEYHFATYFQDNLGNFSISEVTLVALAAVAEPPAEAPAVPEPSSVALLGLGGIALILRRRK